MNKASYPTIKELIFYKEKAEEYKILGYSSAVADKKDIERRLIYLKKVENGHHKP
jgi:hypothetical protein